MRFKDKYVVVTGAAQGIGLAIATRIYEEGGTVAMLDMNEALICSAAKRLDASGDRAIGVYCNVADRNEVFKIFEELENRFGKIDALINNAGITKDTMFHKMTDEQWDSVLAVNLGGVYNCCKAVVSGMRKRSYGRIVNLASVSAFGNVGQTNYGAAKSAVIGFTKCLARELARYQCTVNCIAPSYINTDMLQAIPEQVMHKFLEAIPMGRLGEPSELAAATAFLASDDASFVTGECLVVSGGSYM